LTFTTEQKLKAVKDEIKMRHVVHGPKVDSYRMTQAEFDKEIGVMEAIKADYERQLEKESTPDMFGGGR
jgi:hypothetical protein